MTTERHIKLGRTTAFISFLLGTILFGIYYLTSDSNILFVGYGFIVLAGLINIGILIAILIKAGKDKLNRNRLLNTCGLMLLNIPVMFAYCWAATVLLGTMRINFINHTDTEITDINIVGCVGGHIDKLKAGESETVWVEITGDCSMHIDYLLDGQRKEETVVGYVTSNMGQKLNHKIDKKDKDIM